jgi:hypothetical protein
MVTVPGACWAAAGVDAAATSAAAQAVARNGLLILNVVSNDVEG